MEAAMEYDSTDDTRDHIGKVQRNMAAIRDLLLQRAAAHDLSKLQEPEKSAFDRMGQKASETVYGSDEYKAAIAELGPALAHHYKVNTHHPEHYQNGVAGMSLLDVLEMLCDWAAASERYKNGSVAQSLTVNKERFGISDQLFTILQNTVKELGWR
jgi:hypothetical protein